MPALLLLRGAHFLDGGLRGCEARDRHAEPKRSEGSLPQAARQGEGEAEATASSSRSSGPRGGRTSRSPDRRRVRRNRAERDGQRAEPLREARARRRPSNAELDVGARGAALLDRDLHELADAGLIERGERVLFEDFVLGVGVQEVAHVIARTEAQRDSRPILLSKTGGKCGRGLREVVHPEAEELGGLRDLVGSKGTALGRK